MALSPMAPQGMPEQEMMTQDQEPAMAQGQNNAMMQGGNEDVEGVSIDEQVASAKQLLQQDQQAGQEIMAKLQQSQLDFDDVELLGFLASKIIEAPRKYEQIISGIIAMHPDLDGMFSGDLNKDIEILGQFVLAAVMNDGGVI